MGGKVVIGVNAYREICTLHLAGQVLVDKKMVLKLTRIAADKAKEMVEKVKSSLAEDGELRKKGASKGFATSLKTLSINHNLSERKDYDFSKLAKVAKTTIANISPQAEVPSVVTNDGDDSMEVVPVTMEEESESDHDDNDVAMEPKSSDASKKPKPVDKCNSDSEEEETVMLTKSLLCLGTFDRLTPIQTRENITFWKKAF